MLTSSLIHPEIMRVLSLCGHGDKILIADGNYPLDSESGSAPKVYLGLTAGIPTVTQVLEVLKGVIPIEKAEVMVPEDGSTPEIYAEFRSILNGMELNGIARWDFYKTCADPKIRLAISTGEKRTFSNILITVGIA